MAKPNQQDEQCLENFSIIIPSWNQETALNALLEKLENTGAEIIVSSEGSRAKSLNAGAKKATRKILWFVHADSQITKENIQSLIESLNQFPDALHYFKLQFAEGGLSAINAKGANLRSSLFDLPYGDQALCLSKQQFELIGAYPEDMPYGEDLLFVRLAKKQAIQLVEIPSFLISSARKYNSQGWVKTSITHWYIMFKLLLKKL
ncbi:glycosyltransferase [Cocleimonas sp. KMM 6892]|uniref:glycosyltransferase n=1 Tax=unclassified Cocleimonas TaxID=2639732 RepID=UPI002DB9C377|nr:MULTISPECIES: glycosyltransferase [unclassified Cocleimonas]MEB8433244.1 glycosyltransferase [Cocleimonas sp. KMM 6892]MEC4715775.1 glycosyltransferase [Cocleimonas sp. KMM 6895]MEC4745236.1 glycosyltransferase [Cocleimonas sp. KMM 6896]